jgi:hypothetical protein
MPTRNWLTTLGSGVTMPAARKMITIACFHLRENHSGVARPRRTSAGLWNAAGSLTRTAIAKIFAPPPRLGVSIA